MKQYHSFPVHLNVNMVASFQSETFKIVTTANKANGPVIFRYQGKKKKEKKKRGKCNTSGVSCFTF